MKGYAKAFAGNPAGDALVKYRVVRQVHYFYPCPGCVELRTAGDGWAGWGPIGRADERESEVVHGTTKTDKNGKFNIDFVVNAEKAFAKQKDPVFEFTVSADITDITGETQGGQTFVQAAYRSLFLTIGLPTGEKIPADGLREVLISASNLSGVTEQVPTELAIYSLQSPERMIRPRYWNVPDQFVLSKEDYIRSFPHDEYGDEMNREKWARTGKVFEVHDSTGKKLKINGGRNLPPGWYLFEASANDKDGGIVKSSRYIELYESVEGRPAAPQYLWPRSLEETAEPGGKAVIETGSSASGVFVIRKIDSMDPDELSGFSSVPFEGRSFRFFTLENGKNRTELPVSEADRGGFGVSDVFVKDNRIYTQDYTIRVPWSNKDLEIHYSSFRNKTIPGSKENWVVNIKGKSKEKVMAEVLTGMYDASLDQFSSQSWGVPKLYRLFQSRQSWNDSRDFNIETSKERYLPYDYVTPYRNVYDHLLGATVATQVLSKYYSTDGRAGITSPPRKMLQPLNPAYPHMIQVPDLVSDPDGSKGLTRDPLIVEDKKVSFPVFDPTTVHARKDFRETAFFFSDLVTDSIGDVGFSFVMPEALTTWKWMTLAHTRDAAFGYSETNIVTQKKLMVQPNAPRFLREGDRMELSVKVSNMTDSEMTGQMSLQLTDPTTGETADGLFLNRQPNQYFTVGAGQSAMVAFPLDVPLNFSRPLTYRVVAQSGNYSDGEEATLPVVSNRMLVTEALPLNMPGDGERHFTFDKLLKSGSSETLNTRNLTVEFTANPAWYAVQALPYLMEYPYECAEQTFNRFYANALASKIVSSSPRLHAVFSRWNTHNTAALLSNLQKNAELKSVLLEETPWVLQGKTEEQQKRNIALLFDMSRMSKELISAFDKLKDMQTAGGSFAWFKDGYEDRYITQYILTGIGRLQQIKALPPAMEEKIKDIVTAGLAYLDKQIRKDYEEDLKAAARESGGKGDVKTAPRQIGELPVQYLYMRSLFPNDAIPGSLFPAVNYYRKQAQHSWVQCSPYMQGMIALALFRTGDLQTAKDILASLRQNSIRDEEKGMYWGGMEGGYYWYEAPVEIQSLLIEAFHEISGDAGIDRQLKTWLLKQKQTHSWATTKATADACYALLLGGTDLLNAERDIEVKLGDKTIEWGGAGAASANVSGANATEPGATEAGGGEAGTGYYKKIFDGPFVNPSMGNIDVTMRTRSGTGSAAGGMAGDGGAGTGNKSGGAGGGGNSGGAKGGVNGGSPAWGAVYWQYFDNLDQITPTGGTKSALRLSKQLFIERNTDKGPVLEPLAENGTLKVGDKVTVRVELKVDRDLEYVHMKDMRAACMEPLDVISGYKWQGGLGYYQSTRDASTDFFFSQLPRGTYVFEYSLSAGQTGNFSNGITTIECMYAPEFSYHSEGIRVSVEASP